MRAITLTHLRPPSIHIGATTLAHPRHHTYASAPPHSHNLRLHRCAQAPPHSGIRATTLTHLRPPFLLSVLIRINQNLAELIRYPPRNFDRFRLISINYEDTIARTYSCTVPTPKHLLQHFHSCASSLSRNHRPHSRASTPMPLRTSAPTSKQGCARSIGVSYPFLRSFTIIGMYLLYKSF